ncbi:MAG: hypothetical protein EOO61_19275, partial [Hymenobacter sp.]
MLLAAPRERPVKTGSFSGLPVHNNKLNCLKVNIFKQNFIGPDMEPTTPAQQAHIPYLAGGGRMGKLIRQFDWSKTVLGSPLEWS